jgi:hypothetical protein
MTEEDASHIGQADLPREAVEGLIRHDPPG